MVKLAALELLIRQACSLLPGSGGDIACAENLDNFRMHNLVFGYASAHPLDMKQRE